MATVRPVRKQDLVPDFFVREKLHSHVAFDLVRTGKSDSFSYFFCVRTLFFVQRFACTCGNPYLAFAAFALPPQGKSNSTLPVH